MSIAHNSCYDMLGLMAKRNLEFRRAYPEKGFFDNLDVWNKVAEAAMDSDWFSYFTGAQFQLHVDEFKGVHHLG